MPFDAPQSPEAEIDRDIEELIGKKVRGTLSQSDMVKLFELQSRRLKLMTSFDGDFRIIAPGR